MTIKLIAFDIDNTLLTDKGELLESSIRAIKKAKKLGCKIVMVTGRPYVSTKPILQKLDLDNSDSEYLALFHGAILQTTSGKIISKKVFTVDEFDDLNKLAVQQKVLIAGETPQYIYTTSPNLDLLMAWESYKNRLKIRVRPISYFRKQKDENKFNIAKVLYIASKEHLDEVENNLPEWLKDHYFVARSEGYCIDISPQGIDKGWALERLTKKLNISASEVMAFGNSDNDIPMINFARIGVAMQNSSRNLLDKANLVTGSNNENGIAQAISKVLNK